MTDLKKQHCGLLVFGTVVLHVFFLICFPQSSMLVKYSKLLFVSVGCVKDAFIKE